MDYIIFRYIIRYKVALVSIIAIINTAGLYVVLIKFAALRRI